jgi:hypothetical protein
MRQQAETDPEVFVNFTGPMQEAFPEMTKDDCFDAFNQWADGYIAAQHADESGENR